MVAMTVMIAMTLTAVMKPRAATMSRHDASAKPEGGRKLLGKCGLCSPLEKKVAEG